MKSFEQKGSTFITEQSGLPAARLSFYNRIKNCNHPVYLSKLAFEIISYRAMLEIYINSTPFWLLHTPFGTIIQYHFFLHDNNPTNLHGL